MFVTFATSFCQPAISAYRLFSASPPFSFFPDFLILQISNPNPMKRSFHFSVLILFFLFFLIFQNCERASLPSYYTPLNESLTVPAAQTADPVDRVYELSGDGIDDIRLRVYSRYNETVGTNHQVEVRPLDNWRLRYTVIKDTLWFFEPGQTGVISGYSPYETPMVRPFFSGERIENSDSVTEESLMILEQWLPPDSNAGSSSGINRLEWANAGPRHLVMTRGAADSTEYLCLRLEVLFDNALTLLFHGYYYYKDLEGFTVE